MKGLVLSEGGTPPGTKRYHRRLPHPPTTARYALCVCVCVRGCGELKTIGCKYFLCMGFPPMPPTWHSLHTRPGDCAVILPTAPSCVRAVSIWCRWRRSSIDAGSWSYVPWETGLAMISDWPAWPIALNIPHTWLYTRLSNRRVPDAGGGGACSADMHVTGVAGVDCG